MKLEWPRGFLICGLALSLAWLSGCEFDPQSEALLREVKAAIREAVRPVASRSRATPKAVVLYSSKAALLTKANSELLHEMYVVTFEQEPKDKSEFGNLVDTLNQGASLEGIYNGFTHSSDYRKLELKFPHAPGRALATFAQELAELDVQLPTRTVFTESDAQALVQMMPDGARSDDALQGSPKPGQTHASGDKKALSQEYIQRFAGSSLFTLKRVLGDEALRVIEAKKARPDQLALWYSNWVIHTCAAHVDFGIPLRNRADASFHYEWARKASRDRITWEVLNRVHRILNETARQKP